MSCYCYEANITNHEDYVGNTLEVTEELRNGMVMLVKHFPNKLILLYLKTRRLNVTGSVKTRHDRITVDFQFFI